MEYKEFKEYEEFKEIDSLGLLAFREASILKHYFTTLSFCV